MTSHLWEEYDGGSTVGDFGTEGEIVRDLTLPGDARITLEKKGSRRTLTVGIYGCMVHTLFFSPDQAERICEQVQADVERIVALFPAEEQDWTESSMNRVCEAVEQFVRKWP